MTLRKKMLTVTLTLACAAPTLFGQARDGKIYTVEELTAPALVPPTMNTAPLPAYGYDKLDYGMTIGIERTPGGRLWACWVGGGDNDKAYFVLASSDDDGATWSDPRLVVDPHDSSLPLNRRIVVGNLWTDPQGRLWLFMDQSMGMFDGRAGVWSSLCENPDAAELVWSDPVRIWHGATLQKPIVLSTGEWLLPVSLWSRKNISGNVVTALGGAEAYPELDPYRMANVMISTDEGQTWERQGGVLFPHWQFDEHNLIERSDGSIWMTARTRNGMYESVSLDKGKTWSEPTPSPIKTVAARHSMRRLNSGRLLLIKHGEQIDKHPDWRGLRSRSHLTAFLSDDEGQTWQGGLLLDERRGVSYPDAIQAPDGTIYVSYDYDRNTAGEILFARFTEEDVLAGGFNSPRAASKQLISKPNPTAVSARHTAEKAEKEAAEKARAAQSE